MSPRRMLRFLFRFVMGIGFPALILLSIAVFVEAIHPQDKNLLDILGNAVLNLLPAALAIAAVPLAASWYLDRFYDLGGLGNGFEYLLLSLFGPTGARPWLTVKEGKITGDTTSTLARIGGPGLLVIYNDNAVVTERGGALERVLEPGYHRLKPFERIWEIVDLRPQHWVYPVSALTRDGIPIRCDVDVTFKIDDRTEDGRTIDPTPDRPYPFTKEAVLKAATATRIREENRVDPVMKWTGRVVIGDAEGILRGLLARYRLDQLVRPGERSGPHSVRREIREALMAQLERSAKRIGVRILSVDIGKIDIQVDLPETQAAKELRDEVLDQWIRTWQAELERDSLIEQAEGEAALAGLEAVGVQAQAEMILTLVEAVQSLLTEEQVSAYRLALRFIETLRWMSFDPNVRAFVPLEPLRFLQKLQETVEQAALLPGRGRPSEDRRTPSGEASE